MRAPIVAMVVLASALALAACREEAAIADAGGVDANHPSQADATTSADAATADDAAAASDGAWVGDATVPLDAASGADAGAQPAVGCADISAQISAATGNTIAVAPGAPGQVIVDGNTTTLREVVQQAQPGDTILLADGTYTFHAANTGHGSYTGLYFTKRDIVLRSQSGNAQAVILDSGYVDHGDQSALITIDAPGVIVADLTVKRSVYHLIHLWSAADGVRIHRVRLEDGGQQFLKASGTDIDDVVVSCSHFQMADEGRANVWGYGALDGSTRCYTGGIDTHGSRRWHVHDNRFQGIHCDAAVAHPAHGMASDTYYGGLAEHAIHMWDAEPGGGHLIERNVIVDCARGIGIGMSADVHDTTIRNNMVFSRFAGGSEHDVGINVERAHHIRIDNNSVFFSSPQAYDNAIEYRFDCSDLLLRNNLTGQAIRARDGATATLSNNVTDAQSGWFVGTSAGDLHLASCNVPTVVGQGAVVAEVTDDIDQEPRGASNDIGADQCSP